MCVCKEREREESNIEPEANNTVKDKELLNVNERVCMIYVCVHYVCTENITVYYMVDIRNS